MVLSPSFHASRLSANHRPVGFVISQAQRGDSQCNRSLFRPRVRQNRLRFIVSGDKIGWFRWPLW
jgi:hypothetical protein